MSRTSASVEVIIEAADTRTFASAADWPGWSRAGTTESAALESLARYAPRYAAVVRRAGLELPDSVTPGELVVAERDPGNASTAFGVPGRVGELDLRRVTSQDAAHFSAILQASWETLAAVAATAPPELRKGPRGGGRDRDEVLAHVAEAEHGYARSMGIRLPASAPIAEVRARIIEVLSLASDGSPLPGGTWPQRYAARRVTWHVLDHAWEIEDRSELVPG